MFPIVEIPKENNCLICILCCKKYRFFYLFVQRAEPQRVKYANYKQDNIRALNNNNE